MTTNGHVHCSITECFQLLVVEKDFPNKKVNAWHMKEEHNILSTVSIQFSKFTSHFLYLHLINWLCYRNLYIVNPTSTKVELKTYWIRCQNHKRVQSEVKTNYFAASVQLWRHSCTHLSSIMVQLMTVCDIYILNSCKNCKFHQTD